MSPFYTRDDVEEEGGGRGENFGGFIPVNIFWKASSTLLASRAEVSINERLFSPVSIH
jgi:hypothetical protein